MPAKIPFLNASASLQDKWRDSTSPHRVNAQIYVFVLLITIGLLRHFLFPPNKIPKFNGTFGSISPSSEPGAKDETVGKVQEIFIYPIKSCAGLSVDKADLTSQGFDLDRRWMIIKSTGSKQKFGKIEKISLREEPRLTFIQPVIEEHSNRLVLKLTAVGEQEEKRKGRNVLVETETVLRPTADELRAWNSVPGIEMYGDFADGRVAGLPSGSMRKPSPSEWISDFLGYPVLLIHFDTISFTVRNAFPIFKPPSDSTAWSDSDRQELHRKRGIEFQDEYPLLVASVASLNFVRNQLATAVSSTDGSDGRGGRAITGIDAGKWNSVEALSMARFRPNIVVKGEFGPFSEDSWERMWILPAENEKQLVEIENPEAMLQLVARCQRCLLTAVDPITADKDPSVPLKLLNRSRMRVKKVQGISDGNGRAGPCFGMYAIPLPLSRNEECQDANYGRFKLGDQIKVRWRPFDLDDEPERLRSSQTDT
ncbi:uncharacterized protein MEPE_00383 [Melanopsichium pennsylvanicum]|uniref:MOSC domain-containing protein n=2 Tax=Melanopsichium pennsylvanicum TaxID=63383 RepID=A0AAJ4XGG1_9BASI|nr:mosc domain protein [Melanopsichium pennsylvanicum 4]SNX81678.1 uncharacterized protein MEPE_00383 [Melanopsichium pennsylvanicum]